MFSWFHAIIARVCQRLVPKAVERGKHTAWMCHDCHLDDLWSLSRGVHILWWARTFGAHCASAAQRKTEVRCCTCMLGTGTPGPAGGSQSRRQATRLAQEALASHTVYVDETMHQCVSLVPATQHQQWEDWGLASTGNQAQVMHRHWRVVEEDGGRGRQASASLGMGQGLSVEGMALQLQHNDWSSQCLFLTPPSL